MSLHLERQGKRAKLCDTNILRIAVSAFNRELSPTIYSYVPYWDVTGVLLWTPFSIHFLLSILRQCDTPAPLRTRILSINKVL